MKLVLNKFFCFHIFKTLDELQCFQIFYMPQTNLFRDYVCKLNEICHVSIHLICFWKKQKNPLFDNQSMKVNF
jgi:hypothetical protein